MLVPTRQPRAASDIDFNEILPMTEYDSEPSRKHSITCDDGYNNIENQDQVEILQPKRAERERPKNYSRKSKKKAPHETPLQ